MINSDGWIHYSIWEHSASTKELYARRCRLEEKEMTCHAQAAELLSPHVKSGETLLDAGCGSGYFFHSLQKRQIQVKYFGIDAAPSLIEMGQKYLPQYGLTSENLKIVRIEDMDGSADHIVCINVLSNIDNYHRLLERMLKCARKTVILRESCKEQGEYHYVMDEYLDRGCRLKVHVNTYPLREMVAFIESYGFGVTVIEDRHTKGQPEMVIGYPHYWKFLVAQRKIERNLHA